MLCSCCTGSAEGWPKNVGGGKCSGAIAPPRERSARVFDGVAQFTNIAGPIAATKFAHGGIEQSGWSLIRSDDPAQKPLGQLRNFFAALAQRG